MGPESKKNIHNSVGYAATFVTCMIDTKTFHVYDVYVCLNVDRLSARDLCNSVITKQTRAEYRIFLRVDLFTYFMDFVKGAVVLFRGRIPTKYSPTFPTSRHNRRILY